MIRKTLGLALLVLGIAVIFYSLYSSFNIFTAKAAPPDIFKLESQIPSQKGVEGIEAQFQEMIGEQLKGIILIASSSSVSGIISLKLTEY